METVNVVHYTNPGEFFSALKSYDDAFMNFALGSLLDSLDSTHRQPQETVDRVLLAVYKGDQLLYAALVITACIRL